MKNKHEKQQKNLIFYRSPGGQLSPDYPPTLTNPLSGIITDVATCQPMKSSIYDYEHLIIFKIHLSIFHRIK